MALILGSWALLALLALSVAWAADEPDDWRDEWCSLECWAPDGQAGPCAECQRRKR